MKRKSKSTRERAGRYLERATDLFVGRPGKTEFEGYDLRKALINVKRALMLDPQSYDALILLGNITHELDWSPKGLRAAIGHYDKAISLEPKKADAFFSKGSALVDARDFKSAEGPARKAWLLTLRDPNAEPFDIQAATLYLRDCLVGRNRWKSACLVLQRALKRLQAEESDEANDSKEALLELLDRTKKRIKWAPSRGSHRRGPLTRVK